MELRNIERLEVVIRRFDFRAFDNRESDGDENIFNLLEDLADQVTRTDGTHDARQRKINTFAGQRGFVRTGFDGGTARFYLRFDVGPKLVEFLADDALQPRRRWFQPVVGNQSEYAGFAS